MYRVTFTSLIAVSLLLVFVHSIRDPGFGEDDNRVGGGVDSPPGRSSSQSVTNIDSPIRSGRADLFKPRPFGINKGGVGGAGSVQVQQGDRGRSRVSGGNGGIGGTVKSTGSENIGGAGGSGSVQVQQGANGESDTSGGNGGSGGNTLRKRQFSMSSGFGNAPSFPDQNVGGRGGDGNVQVQGDGPNSISGGNGGAGGNVFGPQPNFPSGESSQSITNMQNSVSGEKRHFSVSSNSDDFPSSPSRNEGGRGGNGNVQVQGGDSNSVSGGNGGPGGNVFGSQPGFPSSQSITNMESSVSAEKRGLGSDKNASHVFPVDH